MMRALAMAMLAIPALAYAQRESCPLLLPEGAVVVARPPDGWSVGPESLVRLTGAGVMRGPPHRMGYLVPSGDKKIKGGNVTTFQFEAGEEKWLWCEYGAAPVQIAKRMDDAATKCDLTSREERRGVYTEVTAVCR